MLINYTSELCKDLLKMCRDMHAESRFKIFRFSDDKIAQLVKQPNVFCVLAKQEEKYIGFFIGVTTDLWFSPDRSAYDLAFYIDPQHRGGFASVRMIHAFEDWAKTQQCRTINVGSSAEIATETARGLYRRLGYNECGFVAHKEI